MADLREVLYKIVAAAGLRIPSGAKSGLFLRSANSNGDAEWGEPSPSWKESVAFASTGALPAYGSTAEVLLSTSSEVLKVDSETVTAGQRVLLPKEESSSNDGIYEVIKAGGASEKWELKRTADANSTEALQDATVKVQKGKVNKGSIWIQTNTVTTVGTTAQTWVGNIKLSYGEDASLNMAMGVSFSSLTSGKENTSFGALALAKITTGSDNTAMGRATLGNVTSGSANTAMGTNAGKTLTTTGSNTAIGDGALEEGSGEKNTVVGTGAGKACKGNSNVFIGFAAGESVGSVSNLLYIANTSTETPLIGGNFETKVLTVNGELIVTGKPAYSGKTEIKTGEEHELSATERKSALLTIETEKSKATTVEILVNKVFAGKVSSGAAVTTNSFHCVPITVPAGQKYEVKVLEGTVVKAFVSSIQI